MAHIMNEAGIATNTAVSHLSKRNRRNVLFRWEGKRGECRIGLCLFVTKHYVPLCRRRAIDSNSENSDVEDNVDDDGESEESHPATDVSDLMTRVMLHMNVTKGGRSQRLALRSHRGNI